MQEPLLADEAELLKVMRSLAGVHRQRLLFAAQSIADDQTLEQRGSAVFCNGCKCWSSNKLQEPGQLSWPD